MVFDCKIADILRKPKLYYGLLGIIIVIILVAVIACNYGREFYTRSLKNETIIEDTCILVKVHNGQLKGRKRSSSRNEEFYAFQEIPFAKPPIEELRFRDPVPSDNWDGVLDVTRNTKTCFQYNNFLHKTNFEETQTEDCLYLNVYTPVCPSSGASLPVMFYIYGSGYLSGSSDYENYAPDHLMDNDIIVVTSNHRLGPLGFISTGDTVIPGNYGMKDQVLALKWVNENIKYFGGDPKKVSIVGHSSGASSVGLHLMSELSKGLYNSAACLSGSPLEPWSYQIYHKRIAYELAGILDDNFNTNNSSRELLQLLRRFPANDINKAVKKLPQSLLYQMDIQGFVFTPVVEPEHENAFITKNIYTAVKDGQMNRVPLLIGMVSEEALCMYDGPLSQQVEDWKRAGTGIDADHSFMVLDNMNIIDENEKKIVGEAIRDLYPGGLFADDLGKTVKYFSDTVFNRGIIRYAELQSNFSDVYFYRFSYYSPSKGNKLNFAGANRVGHGDENIFLWIFNGLNIRDRASPMDILTSERYRTMVTNFVKYSNPTPNKTSLLNNVIWPKLRPDKFQFVDINETITIQTKPMNETYDGWVEIYEKLARKPLMTF